VVYAPGTFTYTKEKVGTRYVFLIIRTLGDPENPADIKDANALQDAIKVVPSSGKWETPTWDSASRDKIRETLSTLGSLGYSGARFGTKDEVSPIAHLIGTAVGWGGNPPSAAMYIGGYPKPTMEGPFTG
jgi:para-nitrobenzyl esterase